MSRYRTLQHHQVLHRGVPSGSHITDGYIVPMTERVADCWCDPLVWLGHKIRGDVAHAQGAR